VARGAPCEVVLSDAVRIVDLEDRQVLLVVTEQSIGDEREQSWRRDASAGLVRRKWIRGGGMYQCEG
jgi:hypothetical protein